MALVSNSVTSWLKKSYQRKILINRKHTKRTRIRQFQSRTGESRKEKDKKENIYIIYKIFCDEREKCVICNETQIAKVFRNQVLHQKTAKGS